MTSYKLAGKVIKFMVLAVIAWGVAFVLYVIIGSKMGYITRECTEYVDVIDIVSIDGKNTTILTDEGEMVLRNVSDIKQGKEGYCADWKSVEEWRDGGE